MIPLNNQQSSAQNETFVDIIYFCFPEEIETIIKLQTKTNDQTIIQAYCKFDLILSNKSMSNELITKEDTFIIDKSIEYFLYDLSTNNFYLCTRKQTLICIWIVYMTQKII